MTRTKKHAKAERRRVFTSDFKKEAVRMLLDAHPAWVTERLGLSGTNVLSRWKRERLVQCGPIASSLES